MEKFTKKQLIFLLGLLLIGISACKKQDLRTPPTPPPPPPEVGPSTQKTEQSLATIYQYHLIIPEDYYTNPTKTYPAIFFLPGGGGLGDDIDLVTQNGVPRWAAKTKGFPFIVITPQNNSSSFYYKVPDLEVLFKEALKRFRIDPKRVYLTGFSTGGITTWEWGSKHPANFAAAAPVAGPGNTNEVCGMKTVPTWAFHNDGDPTYQIGAMQRTVDALKDCGGDVALKIYKNSNEHEGWTNTYQDTFLYEWFLRHVKS